MVREVKTRGRATELCKSCRDSDPKVFDVDNKRRMRIAGVKEEKDLGK